jgi:hypothetical protein
VSSWAKYRNDPIGYAYDVLDIGLTEVQAEILQSLTEPPFKTLVKSGNSVGKSLTAAVAACWFYDCRIPSITITTAPRYTQVTDIIWKEIRRLRYAAGLGGFTGPKIPRLEKSPEHYAYGTTANTSDAFQGHHGREVFVIFDEATAISGEIWEAAHSMANVFLAIYNPTDLTTPCYAEENQANRPYTIITMSQLDHPNVTGWLANPHAPLAVPHAVKPHEMELNLRAWSLPVAAEDRKSTDIQWPPARVCACCQGRGEIDD